MRSGYGCCFWRRIAGFVLRVAWDKAVLASLKFWMCSPVELSSAGRLGLRVRKSRVAFSDRRCDLGIEWIDLDSVSPGGVE